jgi:hypothetical protein
VAVLVIALVLVMIMSIWQMVTLKQDMSYMCNELLEIATVTGKIGPEVEARYEELCGEIGLRPSVAFSANYFEVSSGKVQLGDVISCTLSTEMSFLGFGNAEFPFDVSVTQSGLSRIYWK